MSPRDERELLRERVSAAVGALFDIEEEIGRGGMAVVYRARDVRLRRRVALKVLPPELAFREDVKSRFLREAQMSAQLSHPNIVPIFAVDEIDGVVFFAMGLVEGETLAQQLAREPRPPLATVRDLLRSVAQALAYAHARGVVHRDVKPDNILVERANGHALVSDFGIARAAEGDARLTVTGIAVGTPAYMSPEQAMGEKDVDGRSDIYALGVVGYQMLAGELPFQAANTPAMLMKHISERPKPLHEMRPDLPANLTHAIERAMAKGRGERWQDASAFRDALDENAERGRATRSHPPVVGADEPRPRDGFFAGVSVAGVNVGVVARAGRPSAPGSLPRLPGLPPNIFDPAQQRYSQDALREWREAQRRWKERAHVEPQAAAGDVRMMSRREMRRARRDGLLPERTPEERIRSAQRAVLSYVLTVGFLAVINMVTSPQFPWFIFPAFGMGIGVVSRIGSLWIDGVPLRRLFRRQPVVATPPGQPAHALGAAQPFAAAASAIIPDLNGVPREILDGPHGAAVREAAESKAVIFDVLAKLSDADRQMLPDIKPTVDTLVERVRSLAQSLHQLDQDASSEAISKLEARIAKAREPGGSTAADGARRMELLERQLATLRDLAGRRVAVAEQLESASVVLQTMRLDLLKLRSSGLDSRLDASTGATQEARALSTDIGRVIDAANEVRKL